MYGPTLGPATLFSNRNPLFTMQSHAPLWLRLALKVRWKVWFRKNTFRPNFASLDRINPWPPIFDIKQLHMFFLQALMNLFETTILLEKMHLSTFKKSHFLPQLEVLRAIHVPSIFWVATPEVKTRNATARAQEKKVSGPGNRIARSMAVWSCSWNPEKWSYSSWLRDYLVITNCYIPFFIWSDSLSSSPIIQLNPKQNLPQLKPDSYFSPKNPSILCPFELCVPWVGLSGNRVVPASWSSGHRSHRWWDWSEPCLLPARFSESKTRALRLQIDAKP